MANFENQLIRLGGNRWIAGSHNRIYFNSLCAFAGIEIIRNSSGKIVAYNVDGERVSNGAGVRAVSAVPQKLWYDCRDGEFDAIGGSDAIFGKIVRAIRAAAAQPIAETAHTNLLIERDFDYRESRGDY